MLERTTLKEGASNLFASRDAGRVFKAKHRESKRIMVIKVIEKSIVLHENLKPQLQREIEVHCRLIHPNIIRMFAYFQDGSRV